MYHKIHFTHYFTLVVLAAFILSSRIHYEVSANSPLLSPITPLSHSPPTCGPPRRRASLLARLHTTLDNATRPPEAPERVDVSWNFKGNLRGVDKQSKQYAFLAIHGFSCIRTFRQDAIALRVFDLCSRLMIDSPLIVAQPHTELPPRLLYKVYMTEEKRDLNTMYCLYPKEGGTADRRNQHSLATKPMID